MICRHALGVEGSENGGASNPTSKATTSRPDDLKTAVNPYGDGFVREAHETEREGQLYNVNENFNSKVDEKGNPRKDGRYLFVVARDIDGVRRIMVVPRFDFDRADGKFLSTHRSMFRKYRDVFGPTPSIEVMGEIEINAGTVVSYNNKAGTGYDPKEAEDPHLFEQRKAIAESMGIDLSKADRVVNYTPIAIEAEKNKEKARIPGRHIEEEEFVVRMKLLYEQPILREMIQKQDNLVQRAYALFPQNIEKNPKRIFNFKEEPLLSLGIPLLEQGNLEMTTSLSQDHGAGTMMANMLINNNSGALPFAKYLDNFEKLVLYLEAKKDGKTLSVPDWTKDQSDLPSRYLAQHAQSGEKTVNDTRQKILMAEGRPDPLEPEKNLKILNWSLTPGEKHYLTSDEKRNEIINAQLLLEELRERFGITKDRGGPFDYKKFSETMRFDEDNGFTEDHIANKMIYDLLMESERSGGQPLKLYDEMSKSAEAAPEDDMYMNPLPSTVVGAYLRILGIRP